ncbi:hypothetical protein V8C42DRAFT_36492 [Trichoderma barbatum]
MPKAHHEHSSRSSRPASDTRAPVAAIRRRVGSDLCSRFGAQADTKPGELCCRLLQAPAASLQGRARRSPPARHRLRIESPLSSSHQTPNPVDAAKKLGLQQRSRSRHPANRTLLRIRPHPPTRRERGLVPVFVQSQQSGTVGVLKRRVFFDWAVARERKIPTKIHRRKPDGTRQDETTT